MGSERKDRNYNCPVCCKYSWNQISMVLQVYAVLSYQMNYWFMQGMIGSGLCYVGMSWCVKRRGPVFTAAFSPLVQIMAAMLDVPVLHEELYLGR